MCLGLGLGLGLGLELGLGLGLGAHLEVVLPREAELLLCHLQGMQAELRRVGLRRAVSGCVRVGGAGGKGMHGGVSRAPWTCVSGAFKHVCE